MGLRRYVEAAKDSGEQSGSNSRDQPSSQLNSQPKDFQPSRVLETIEASGGTPQRMVMDEKTSVFQQQPIK